MELVWLTAMALCHALALRFSLVPSVRIQVSLQKFRPCFILSAFVVTETAFSDIFITPGLEKLGIVLAARVVA